MNIQKLNDYLQGKYVVDVMDEAVRKHADGSVCKSASPDTCPINKKAEAGEMAVTGKEKSLYAEKKNYYMLLRAVQKGCRNAIAPVHEAIEKFLKERNLDDRKVNNDAKYCLKSIAISKFDEHSPYSKGESDMAENYMYLLSEIDRIMGKPSEGSYDND